MEFNEKLQELRKSRGLTQEELAKELYVSRTAVSKWESARGYPNIDSLKAIAKFFEVTVDELLSNGDVLGVAKEEGRRKEEEMRGRVFALLDCAFVLLLFLPFFGQESAGGAAAVSLLRLTQVQLWLRSAYFAAVGLSAAMGICGFAVKNAMWLKHKNTVSLLCSAAGALLFMVSRQPYAAAYAFVFCAVKAFVLIKKG